MWQLLLILIIVYVVVGVLTFAYLLYGLHRTGVGFHPLAALRVAIVWPYWILVWIIGGTVV